MLLSNTERQMTMRRIQRAGKSDLSVIIIPSYKRLFTNQATINSGEVVKYGNYTTYVLLLCLLLKKKTSKNNVRTSKIQVVIHIVILL